MRRPIGAAWLVLATIAGSVGCAASAPEVPVGPDGAADPVLVEGRDVWVANCSRCHGAGGGGGRGPRLDDGLMVDAYPDPADEIALVAAGRGQMPAFADRLDDAEIEAVVRYTREVL